MHLSPKFDRPASFGALQASLIDPEEDAIDVPEDETTFFASETWKEIKKANNKFWEYTCNFLYVTISLGIVLNLSGFAYTVSPKEGLTITTISQHREEKLWKQEMKRYEMEAEGKKAVLMHQMEMSQTTSDISSL